MIDRIKAEVDKACGCSVVSCADILTVAARDSVVAVRNSNTFIKNVIYLEKYKDKSFATCLISHLQNKKLNRGEKKHVLYLCLFWPAHS